MNNPSDTLKQFKVTMNGQDVTGMLRRLSVVQSIEQPMMTSIVNFTDSKYQVQQTPVGKPITISVTPTGGNKALTVNHVVEKIDQSKVSTSGKYMVGSICGVPPEYKGAVTKRITKSYEGQTPEKIVEGVLKDMGASKKLASGTFNTVPAQFLSNRNSPFEVIEKVKKHPGTGSHTFFFENHDGYNLKSVEDLIKQSPVATLVFDHAAYTDVNRSMGSINNIFDLDINNGSFGDTLLAEQEQDTLASPENSQIKPGDKAPSAGSGVQSRLVSNLTQTEENRYIRNSIEQYDAKRGQDFSKQRQSLSKLTAAAKVLVTLRPDIVAGSVITIKSNGASGFTDANPNLSHDGKWLVKKVTHVCDFSDASGAPYGRTILECIGKIS